MNKFVHVHVMRSGGTSFNRALNHVPNLRIFRDKSFRFDRIGEIVRFTNTSEYLYPRRFDENSFDCVIGHFTVNKYFHLEWKNVAFMRDPVERIVSYFSVWCDNRLTNKYGEKPIPNKKIIYFANQIPNQVCQMTNENLDLFDFVGITERHEESMLVLEKILKIKIPNTKVHLNKAKRKRDISEKLKNKVRKINSKDQSLYEEALKRFDKAVARYL